MTQISTISTYLPPWEDSGRRVPGSDEDAVTMAVEAGRAALEKAGHGSVERVVLVTRDLPLLEGGNGAALLAGLGLPADVEVVERVGGAPAALDAVLSARPQTLVVGADLDPAGAGAVVVSTSGLHLRPVGRISRSLPVQARSADGITYRYGDPRLLRERGLKASLERTLPEGRPAAVAGVPYGQGRALCEGEPPRLPSLGSSATFFALAALAERKAPGVLVAVEEATVTASMVEAASNATASVQRLEPEARPLPVSKAAPGPEIPISLAAYERAFEPKVRWEAARCEGCGTLAHPPRYRCRECGAESRWESVPLPRRAEVYTAVTVRTPVPGLPTPYSLAVVQLDGSDVRVLAKTTAAEAGSVSIGDTGRMTLRRVAVRAGVPDYGYAFWPDGPSDRAEVAR
ncbi:OB-fold domain-containing protein [Streptomyces sp. NPDC048254]|uniref:Zn-ribbon domain-containing OB-fold protein n=1 Tax=Streptomyces sp. NPDC048254 TaxID=3365525 RepID=UPI00371E908A